MAPPSSKCPLFRLSSAVRLPHECEREPPLSVGRKEVPARVVSSDRRLGRLRRSGRATLPLVTSASCSFGTAQNPDHLGEGMRQQSTFQEKTLPPETTSTGASSGEPRCLLSGSCPQLFDTVLRTIHHPVDENSVGVGRYLGLKILDGLSHESGGQGLPEPETPLGARKADTTSGTMVRRKGSKWRLSLRTRRWNEEG